MFSKWDGTTYFKCWNGCWNFEFSIFQKNLLLSIIQLTQLPQLCHLFSQRSMDLPLVNNLYLKGYHQEYSRKGQLFHVTLLHKMSSMCCKMFYFQWNVIRINLDNFGNYDVCFKRTKITNFSLFIHRLHVPRWFRVCYLYILSY